MQVINFERPRFRKSQAIEPSLVTVLGYNSNDAMCYAETNDWFTRYAGYYEPSELDMYGNGAFGDGTTSWASGYCTNQLHWGSNL